MLRESYIKMQGLVCLQNTRKYTYVEMAVVLLLVSRSCKVQTAIHIENTAAYVSVRHPYPFHVLTLLVLLQCLQSYSHINHFSICTYWPTPPYSCHVPAHPVVLSPHSHIKSLGYAASHHCFWFWSADPARSRLPFR